MTISDAQLGDDAVTPARQPDLAEALIEELRGQAKASTTFADDHADPIQRAEFRGEARAYRDAARLVYTARYGKVVADGAG